VLKAEMERNGQADVKLHEYSESGFNLKNVVCSIKGESDKVILVCAHYDSRMEHLDDSQSRAPGAVDNASGMSVLLELSRIIASSRLQFENTIQLVFFSGEEQGLWGSKHYAKFIKDNNVELSKLINLDMVGYCPSGRRVCIVERDVGNAVSTNDQSSEEFAQTVEMIAKAYTELHTKPGPIYDSDYMPFEELGFVVSGVYDGGAEEYPHYHTSADEAKHVNTEYVTEVAKMILSTLLKEGNVTNTM
jgi:Zn-dependent M28 family amino/carboxypeptidase